MIINSNLLAMNANRMFGITTKDLKKRTEKLSSGYRINRAADDAAGLSISEKMRRQIRGLHKAEENIQDGISLCQVADGALNEVHDILQRMNELSVQAGNDTNSQTDRAYIQTEIDALTQEIDRIANQTTFNEEIYPLLGKDKSKISQDGYHWVIPSRIKEVTIKFGNQKKADGTYYSAIVDGKRIIEDQIVEVTFLYDELTKGKNILVGNATTWHRYGDLDEKIHYLSIETEIRGLSLSQLKVDDEGRIYYENIGGNSSYICISANGIENSHYVGYDYLLADKKIDDDYNYGKVQSDIWIHMATESGIGMFIDLVDATAKGIGIDRLDVSSKENAGNAINSIKGAIEKVSEYRTVFGAQQNRLEYAMRINGNIAENTTDAESCIRDTDVAKEIMEHSKDNILQQAGVSMLTQANQMPQYALQLLG